MVNRASLRHFLASDEWAVLVRSMGKLNERTIRRAMTISPTPDRAAEVAFAQGQHDILRKLLDPEHLLETLAKEVEPDERRS